MILQNRAYVGKQYVYRAYHKNKIIWDHGDYVNGVAAGVLDGSATPKPVDPTPSQLHAEATAPGTGIPHTMELLSIMAHADETMEAVGNVHAAQTIRVSGKAEGDIHAVGAPSTYSQVFAAAQAECELSAQASPRTADIEYGAGIADASIIASLCPTVAEFLQMLMAAGATIDGSAVHQIQEPEKIVASTRGELIASGCAAAVPVHTVTFMHNGVKLYSTAVIDGYDCPDPVASGKIATPTQEPTAQYTFAYSGWTRTEGGEADETALSNITADTVIYAAFEGALRSYTITYYDDDGSYLNSESLTYGAIPSYVPFKDDYAFDDWYPEVVPVEGDASYSAVWVDKIGFASADWATIAELSESGKASRHFNVLDSKIVNLTIDGVEYPFTVKIIGFDHDDLSDGSGKAGMSLMFFTTPDTMYAYYTGALSSITASFKSGYELSNLRDVIENTISAYLPDDLSAVIKKAVKKYNKYNKTTIYTLSAKLWPLSVSECYSDDYNTYMNLGERYAAFADPTNYVITKASGGTATYNWMRDWGKGYSSLYRRISGGGMASASAISAVSNTAYVTVGFAI